MSTNISKEKREQLIVKISEIKAFIEKSADDKNKSNLLSYMGDLQKELINKHYGLIFEEHRERIDEILSENLPVLTEEKDLFIDNGGQQNFLIEGDNLASLQLLEKTHRGKIDLIYIDPPYNTGNKDFIYDDNFVDSKDTFRHSKWCSFMQKRLELARKLLSEKGVIFISIDDNEQAALKLLCDDVFGEGNWIAQIAWQNLDTVKNDSKYFSDNFEYILCYSKKKENLKIQGIKKSEKQRAYYKNYDNDPRGDYLLTPIHAKSGSESGIYEFTFSNGQTWIPPEGTFPRFSKETLKKLDEEKRLYLDPKCKKVPQKKTYCSEVGERMPPITFWNYGDFGSTRQSNKELAELTGKGVFQNPKPTLLISKLIDLIYKNKEFTILDFFAGSGTTGHAVLKLNAEDGGSRKFILCTNNENSICRDVTYERIKRVIQKENYAASLKYFRVEYIPITDRVYYDYADQLLEHTKELVELENAVNFTGNAQLAIILNEDELDSFCADKEKISRCKKIYLGHECATTAEQDELFVKQQISVIRIPNYYYKED